MSIPNDLQIRPLKPEEWHLIAAVYEKEFENEMPVNPAQSIFYGVFLNNDCVGFAHIELCFNLNAFYITPEHRHKNFAQAMFEMLDSHIPPEFPVIIMPDKRLERLLEHYNYRQLPETEVWRKDY